MNINSLLKSVRSTVRRIVDSLPLPRLVRNSGFYYEGFKLYIGRVIRFPLGMGSVVRGWRVASFSHDEYSGFNCSVFKLHFMSRNHKLYIGFGDSIMHRITRQAIIGWLPVVYLLVTRAVFAVVIILNGRKS
jgi:hypothetical protein